MKRYKAVLLVTALVISLGYQVVYGQAPKQAAAPTANATIERGRYVVEIGGCNDCHTAGYAEAGGKAAEADRSDRTNDSPFHLGSCTAPNQHPR